MGNIVEICCGSYEDALAAEKGGASRIELNSALYLGGLTPTLASLMLTKENTDLKVIAMLRPRAAGFCYSKEEYQVMKADAEILMKNGADGLAFGFLHQDAKIDTERTQEILEIIKKYQGEAVFHRAFDCVKDPYQALEQLIDLRIDRVLTSGLKNKAIEGIPLLAVLQATYGTKIELLAGSGINAENAMDLIHRTGITQVHSSCKNWSKDSTTIGNQVSYAYAPEPHQEDYEYVDENLVREFVDAVEI